MENVKEENKDKKLNENVKEALRAAGYTDDFINQASFFDVNSTTKGAFNRITNVFVLNEAERKRANDAVDRLGSTLSNADIAKIKENVCYFTSGQLAELELIVNKPANEIKQAFKIFAVEFKDYLTELQRKIDGIEEKINNLSNDVKAQTNETIDTLKSERARLTNAIAESTDLLKSIQGQLDSIQETATDTNVRVQNLEQANKSTNDDVKSIKKEVDRISGGTQQSKEALDRIEGQGKNLEDKLNSQGNDIDEIKKGITEHNKTVEEIQKNQKIADERIIALQSWLIKEAEKGQISDEQLNNALYNFGLRFSDGLKEYIKQLITNKPQNDEDRLKEMITEVIRKEFQKFTSYQQKQSHYKQVDYDPIEPHVEESYEKTQDNSKQNPVFNIKCPICRTRNTVSEIFCNSQFCSNCGRLINFKKQVGNNFISRIYSDKQTYDREKENVDGALIGEVSDRTLKLSDVPNNGTFLVKCDETTDNYNKILILNFNEDGGDLNLIVDSHVDEIAFNASAEPETVDIKVIIYTMNNVVMPIAWKNVNIINCKEE